MLKSLYEKGGYVYHQNKLMDYRPINLHFQDYEY